MGFVEMPRPRPRLVSGFNIGSVASGGILVTQTSSSSPCVELLHSFLVITSGVWTLQAQVDTVSIGQCLPGANATSVSHLASPNLTVEGLAG